MLDLENYTRTYPNWPPLVATDRWVYGVWMIGNNYRAAMGYYGEYPPTYLARIKALFPSAQNVLHLFSGMVQRGLWPHETTFDIDISDLAELEQILWRLAEKVSYRAKSEGLAGHTVVLKLKTRDFRTRTRHVSLDEPTVMASRIFEAAVPLLKREATGT